MVKKLIRGVLKSLITLISIAVLLTSFIGGISIFQVVSDPESIDIDPDSVDMSLGILGNHFTIDMFFNNEHGYFTFENFTVSVTCELRDKQLNQNITYLDKILYQEDLIPGQEYYLSLVAIEEDFSPENYLLHNNGSWYDPEVAAYIENGTITETTDVQALCYPYLLWHYDVAFTLQIRSTYNLGLVFFGLSIDFVVDYDQFFTQDYPVMKEELLSSI